MFVKDLDLLQWDYRKWLWRLPSLPPTSTWTRCLSLTERRGTNVFAPKEIKQETGESLVYNPHRTLVSKEFTFDAAHHLFHYEGKCKSLHGHTYHLQIAVSGFLDERA